MQWKVNNIKKENFSSLNNFIIINSLCNLEVLVPNVINIVIGHLRDII